GLRLIPGRQSNLVFSNDASVIGWAVALGAAILLLTFQRSARYPAALVLLAVGIAIGLLAQWGKMLEFAWGPASLSFLQLRADDLWGVLPLLVIPQFALTFGDSIVATENAAKILYVSQAPRATVAGPG